MGDSQPDDNDDDGALEPACPAPSDGKVPFLTSTILIVLHFFSKVRRRGAYLFVGWLVLFICLSGIYDVHFYDTSTMGYKKSQVTPSLFARPPIKDLGVVGLHSLIY